MKKHLQSGFTLIELLVVISIIGILASVVLASLSTAREKANDARRLADMKQLQNALELYYSDFGQYPAVPSTIVADMSMIVPKYMPTVPVDPNPVSPLPAYGYRYAAGASYQSYTLLVNLESDSVNWCRPPAVGPGYPSWESANSAC